MTLKTSFMFVDLLFCFCFGLSVEAGTMFSTNTTSWALCSQTDILGRTASLDDLFSGWALLQPFAMEQRGGSVVQGRWRRGGGWARRVLRAGWGTEPWQVPPQLRPRSGEGEGEGEGVAAEVLSVVPACRALSSLASPGLPEANYRFTEPASAQTGPSKTWEPLWFDLVLFSFFFFMPSWEKIKAERPIL